MEGTGRANGMTFDGSGNLIACADEKTELRLLSRGGASAGAEETAVAVTVLVAGYGGKRLNGPNDAFVAPSGGIYVTDPFYQRPWWSYSAMPQARQRVYYLPPGAAELVPVAEDLTQPNGIIGTPDGSTLYVADIGANRTWRYRVNADGSLVDKTLFCSLGSDGMTIDAEGNLYLTGQGVTVFDPTGKKIAWIRVPESWTSNVCFGGADRHTLFITASAHVYRLAMRVGGAFTQGK
jgi:gluconolactonase